MNNKSSYQSDASFILKANRCDYNIDGAPYKIGQKVKVLNNPNKDDTFDVKLINKKGEIIFFEYDCGCGQTFPTDPMIGVKFSNGSIDEFWKEELQHYV
ncbi:MAG: hypothetical protein WB290_07060 [Smithella sp.]